MVGRREWICGYKSNGAKIVKKKANVFIYQKIDKNFLSM